MKYIVFTIERHYRYRYFMGFIDTNPVLGFERKKAKECTPQESQEIIALLSGPYSKWQRAAIKQ